LRCKFFAAFTSAVEALEALTVADKQILSTPEQILNWMG